MSFIRPAAGLVLLRHRGLDSNRPLHLPTLHRHLQWIAPTLRALGSVRTRAVRAAARRADGQNRSLILPTSRGPLQSYSQFDPSVTSDRKPLKALHRNTRAATMVQSGAWDRHGRRSRNTAAPKKDPFASVAAQRAGLALSRRSVALECVKTYARRYRVIVWPIGAFNPAWLITASF